MTDRTIDNLRRRLERAELLHLRQHAAELAERLELSEERAHNAESAADYWRESHMSLIESLQERDDVQLGMTRDGVIGIVANNDTPEAA